MSRRRAPRSGSSPGGRGSRVVPAAFSAVFLLIGLAVAVPFFVLPMSQVVRARSWDQARCTIDDSRVRSSGDTFSVAVAYHYERDGVRYSGKRPHFMGGSSSGREAKQRMVDAWVPGSTVPCWVDPRRPDQSVLHRGLTGDMWFGLIPGLFVLVGGLALWGSLRRPAVVPATPLRDPAGVLPVEARVGPEPRTLSPESTPRVRFFGLLVAALFWNGIVQLFVREVIAGWRAGRSPIFMTVFMLPFVAIGLGLLGGALLQLLRMFGPRVSLTLRPGRLLIGERAELEWQVHGRIERMKRLTVHLEGREQASLEQHEGKKVQTSVFARLPVGEGEFQGGLRRGSGRVVVPEGSMHSFTSPHNKIQWVVAVHGQLDGWPDLKEEFPVGVLPAAASPT